MPKLGKNEYLVVADVARQLGISTSAVRRFTTAGILPAVRNPFNKYRLYRQKDVDELMKQVKRAEKDAGHVD